MLNTNFLDVEENNLWKDRWEKIVSTDYDYDSDFLIRLVTHKLELMYKYFKFIDTNVKKAPSNFNLNRVLDDERNISDICDNINSCYELGVKILTFNYGEKADKLFEECGNIAWLVESSEEEDYYKWYKLTLKAENDRKKDIEKFFTKIGKTIKDWWV